MSQSILELGGGDSEELAGVDVNELNSFAALPLAATQSHNLQ